MRFTPSLVALAMAGLPIGSHRAAPFLLFTSPGFLPPGSRLELPPEKQDFEPHALAAPQIDLSHPVAIEFGAGYDPLLAWLGKPFNSGVSA